MKPQSLLLVAVLCLGACAYPAEPPPVVASTLDSGSIATVAPAGQPQQNCREYSFPIRIGGVEQQGYGQACQQADGTWQIVPPAGTQATATAAQTPTVYTAYPYPYPSYGYPYYGPAFGFGFGFASFHHRHRW